MRKTNRTATTAATLAGMLGLAAIGAVAAGPAAAAAAAAHRRAAGTPYSLRAAVTAALDADHRAAVAALWTDRIAASAWSSTRGPALQAMRMSGATRARDGLRIRVLHDRYQILHITISPAATTAIALVRSDQELLPTTVGGVARGRRVDLDEQAQVVLHRLSGSGRFVVWRVTLQ